MNMPAGGSIRAIHNDISRGALQNWCVGLRPADFAYDVWTERRLNELSCKLLLVGAVSACFLASPLTPRCFGSTKAAPSASLIETSYRDMYDLRFGAAHQVLHEWERLHPEDPLGPASDAAAYLFSEFNRLGILQAQLFLTDANVNQAHKLAPDPEIKQAFESELSKSLRLADSVLARTPQDRNALFAKVLDLGLRSDYLSLIENRELASLHYMKSAGILAEALLKIDPSYYDAYLAVGVENYLLSLNPAPVRWMLGLYGVETSKARGIQELRLTAQKGHYLRPYARLLLAVAELRDNNQGKATGLLQGLAREFPDNELYTNELARLQCQDSRGC